MGRAKLTVSEKFNNRTELNITTPIINGCHCLDWTGGYSGNGYGWVLDDDKKLKLAHRKHYELTCGSIPTGHLVLHTCDRRSCVEPSHLRTGTQRDNAADRKARPKKQLTEKQKEEIIKNQSPINDIARMYSVSRMEIKSIKGE